MTFTLCYANIILPGNRIKRMQIILKGNIPSKKNSRINTKSGRSFPSSKYTAWHKDAMLQLREQEVEQAKYKMVEEIALTFYAQDLRKFDLTNKTESVMDLLVDYGLLEDDNCYVIPHISIVFGGVDRENPRCEITLV